MTKRKLEPRVALKAQKVKLSPYLPMVEDYGVKVVDKQGKAIGKIIEGTLMVDNNESIAMKEVLEVAECFLEVTGIDFTKCAFSNEDITALSGGLKNNAKISHLTLDDCGINDDLILILCDLLRGETLLELNLKNNQITDVGAKSLAKALTINKSLNLLNLKANKIGDDGVNAFLQLIQPECNDTLGDIYLSRNNLTEAGKGTVRTINATLRPQTSDYETESDVSGSDESCSDGDSSETPLALKVECIGELD